MLVCISDVSQGSGNIQHDSISELLSTREERRLRIVPSRVLSKLIGLSGGSIPMSLREGAGKLSGHLDTTGWSAGSVSSRIA